MAEPSSRPQPRGAPRRAFLRLIGVGLAASLAACSTVVPRPKAPPPPPPRHQAPPPRTGGLPVDQTRNRVAVLVPLGGVNAGVGQSIANAANMALLDTGGERIRITTYDTTQGAALAAQKAIAEGNRLILGPLLADDVRAVAPVAAAAGVPVIAFSNDSDVAGNGVYLMGFTVAQSVERIVAYAHDHGITRFAGLMPLGTYGRRASTDLIRAAQAAGGSVTVMVNYDRTPAGIQAAIRKLGQQPFDAIMIADSGRVAIQMAPSVRKIARDAKLLGTEIWNTDERALAASPAVRGAWFASVSDGVYDQFAQRYHARYGRTPYRIASLGYDATLLAVRVGRDWKTDTPFPVRRLTDPDGFSGVDGAFRFGGDGIAQRALQVNEVGPSGFVTISPAPRGFGG